MPEVWFIRHGESAANANWITKDPALTELTPKGEAEAARVPAAFGERKPSLIVTSSYVRAQQTAVPTLNHFAPIPQEVWPVHEFTYLAPHRYNGTRMSERMPLAIDYWEKGDPHFKEDGAGESYAECMGRVEQLITRLQNHDAPFIAVFSHALFLRLLIMRLLTGDDTVSSKAMTRGSRFVRAIKFPNCAICVTQFTQSGGVSFSNIQTVHLK
ncbi:MAG: histidine phosphatase family protein [Chloroflexota bacterium]